MIKNNNPNHLVNFDVAAACTGVNRASLYRWRKREGFPILHHAGHRLMVNLNELSAWVNFVYPLQLARKRANVASPVLPAPVVPIFDQEAPDEG